MEHSHRINFAHMILLSAIEVALLTGGCGGHSPSTLYSQEQPIVFEPCASPLSDIDQPTRSFAGFLKALTDFNWKLEAVQADQGTVVASNCLRGGDYLTECVAMSFVVNGDGAVFGYADMNRPISNEMAGHAMRWMRNVDQRFATYRCMIRSAAAAELGIHGIEMKEEASAQAAPSQTVTPPAEPSPAPTVTDAAAAPAETGQASAEPSHAEVPAQ